eukprot:5778109-Pyramimonas_sp.AAC.1
MHTYLHKHRSPPPGFILRIAPHSTPPHRLSFSFRQLSPPCRPRPPLNQFMSFFTRLHFCSGGIP